VHYLPIFAIYMSHARHGWAGGERRMVKEEERKTITEMRVGRTMGRDVPSDFSL
jgi:hypothetical protein